ncbi:uncharacterized protein SOCEGT47_055300 [Sorangium cellulosum]|uniref:Uncharacterized protein n=2 Tax=Sorangium cellulosum TaxID=56 RepID=A0A4P2Q6G3_SORCE|nr:uncharacterized protein SOCEGT47_055300 [Sorangium cellulosum]
MRLVSWIADWSVDDDQPPLLIGLNGPDTCIDEPYGARGSAFRKPGPSVRVVVTVSGSSRMAEQWAERLAFRPEDVTFIPVGGFRLDELDEPLRDRLAWAALDGPGPRAYVEAILASLRARGASRLEALLSILAHAFAPLGPSDAAQLLDVEEAEVRAWLDAHGEVIDPLIERCEGDALRFRHEALRAAWEAVAGQRTASCERRFAAAARRIVLARISGSAQELRAGAYLRRYAGAHLLASDASDAELLTLCDPRWAWPCSREDLAARRVEVEEVRRKLAAPLEQPGAGSASPDAISRFVRVALSQGALATLHEAWRKRDDCWDGHWIEEAWEGTARALADAFFGLATHASPLLHERLAGRALDVVRRTGTTWRGDGWQDASTLLTAAQATSGGDAATFARWAVAATWRAEQGPDRYFDVWLTAASFLPSSEADALLQQLIERARSSPNPGAMLGRAGRARGLRQEHALALFHAAMSLPPRSRANALAPLLPLLPPEERALAVSVSFEAVVDLLDVEGERLDDEGYAEALTPYLDLPELVRLLDRASHFMSPALSARFAAVGEPARALETIDRLSFEGIDRARALLRAAAIAGGGPLVDAARRMVSTVKPEWVPVVLVREQPLAAIEVFGFDASLSIAESGGDETSQYARIAALSSLCRVAPEASRPSLAALAIAAYREDSDPDTLGGLVDCAPWLSLEDAAWLFAVSLGDAGSGGTLKWTLSHWGGVEHLAPLIARLGGDGALAAVADVLPEALRWTPQAEAAGHLEGGQACPEGEDAGREEGSVPRSSSEPRGL